MAINCTELFKRSICCLIRSPKRDLTYAWLVSLVLVFICFIVACVAASKMSSSTGSANAGSINQSQDSSAAFSAVWTALLLVVISVTGTVILRSYQTALSIGFLLGVIFIMANQMLIIFAIYVDTADDPANTASQKSSQQAMAVFAWFLFMIYAAFGTMLATFRNDVIKEEVLTVEPAEDFAMAKEEGEDDNQM